MLGGDDRKLVNKTRYHPRAALLFQLSYLQAVKANYLCEFCPLYFHCQP